MCIPYWNLSKSLWRRCELFGLTICVTVFDHLTKICFDTGNLWHDQVVGTLACCPVTFHLIIVATVFSLLSAPFSVNLFRCIDGQKAIEIVNIESYLVKIWFCAICKTCDELKICCYKFCKKPGLRKMGKFNLSFPVLLISVFKFLLFNIFLHRSGQKYTIRET